MFKKFTEIENSYRTKFVEKCILSGFNNTEYEITEKVHGANFSFWISKAGELKVGSRNQFVDGSFYNCQEVIDQYADSIRELRFSEDSVYRLDEPDWFVVYGELFGPGIQSGVYYGEKKNFVAFEIARLWLTKNADGGPLWSIDPPYRNLIEFYTFGIPRVPVLGVANSLKDAISFNPQFESKIPEMFGYKNKSKNFAEGIVIRPYYHNHQLNNGSRIILKKKIDKFSEISRNKKQPAEFKEPIELTGVYADACSYINENRLNSLISKIGTIDQKDFGKAIYMMTDDILNDLIKDGLLNENWKRDVTLKDFRKFLNRNVSQFLREHLLNNL